MTSRPPTLPAELAPLSAYLTRFEQFGTDSGENAPFRVAPQPWIATEAWTFWIYPPADPRWLEGLAMLDGPGFPSGYRELLKQMNGCFAFGLSLYGIPAATGLLDRRSLKALDLRLANSSWSREFQSASSLFHFGSRKWTPTESLGYFALGPELIALRKSGEVVARWPSLRELLAEELPAAEAYDRRKAPPGAWPVSEAG